MIRRKKKLDKELQMYGYQILSSMTIRIMQQQALESLNKPADGDSTSSGTLETSASSTTQQIQHQDTENDLDMLPED